MYMRPLAAMTLTALALALAACGSDKKQEAAPTATTQAQASSSSSTSAPTTGTSPSSTAQATAARTATAAASPTAAGPQALTPAQTEGPYYPPNKPTDRDNDLTVVKGQSGTAAGDTLLLSGVLLHKDGSPVAGATVEIWHVDKNGIYLHPQQDESKRDKNFQSYGESVTDANGNWSFRTIDPPAYEGRPRHIHVKVRVDGKEVLTTQIYFEGDPLLARDGVSAGADRSLMTVKEEKSTEAGKTVMKAVHKLVIA